MRCGGGMLRPLSSPKADATPVQVNDDLHGKALMDQLRLTMRETIRLEQRSRDALLLAASLRVRGFLRIVLGAGFAVGVLIGTFTSRPSAPRLPSL